MSHEEVREFALFCALVEEFGHWYADHVLKAEVHSVAPVVVTEDGPVASIIFTPRHSLRCVEVSFVVSDSDKEESNE